MKAKLMIFFSSLALSFSVYVPHIQAGTAAYFGKCGFLDSGKRDTVKETSCYVVEGGNAYGAFFHVRGSDGFKINLNAKSGLPFVDTGTGEEYKRAGNYVFISRSGKKVFVLEDAQYTNERYGDNDSNVINSIQNWEYNSQIKEYDECRLARIKTFAQIARVKNPVMIQKQSLSSEPIRHDYPDYPYPRAFLHRFILTGSGAIDIMNSPTFMQSITEHIVQNCAYIGLVQFTSVGTDVIHSFGWVNGKARRFICLPIGHNENAPSWGYEFCP